MVDGRDDAPPDAVVVVGASAGGVEALTTLTADLDESPDAAVLVVLHELAARVVDERVTPAPVVVAIARESRLRAGWMRERAEAQRERMEALAAQIADQLRLAEQHCRRD
jgi:CheB methylesterase